MASTYLPVELWNQILEETILLPKFLDPECLPEITDPLYSLQQSEPDSDQDYWEIERFRNNLQQVCKSWDRYLRQFEHRFVRIDDVHHGLVPKQALRKAIRISLRVSLIPGTPDSASGERSLLPLIEDLGNLSVEILDLAEMPGSQLPMRLMEASKNLPHLQVILKASIQPKRGTQWVEAIASLPNLKFLNIVEDFAISPLPEFRAENLTTLSYCNSALPLLLPFHQCSFPSLRHLRFINLPFSSTNSSRQVFIRALTALGHNLWSLQVGNVYTVVIPKEVLELCPQLKRLDCGLFIRHPPPPNHPLHTLSTHIGPELLSADSGPRFPPTLMGGFSSLRRLILMGSWESVEMEIKSTGAKTVFSQMRDMLLACRKHGVTLEDCSGILFENSGMEDAMRTIRAMTTTCSQ